MRNFIKRFTQEVLWRVGYSLQSTNHHGLNFIQDIKRTDVETNIILDVGANVGQSTMEYLRYFKTANVYSFEPVEKNYSILMERCESYDRFHGFKIAMSNLAGEEDIYVNENSGQHSLVSSANSIGVERVKVNTVDTFCNDLNLDKVCLLKIDTEGADLKVLNGCSYMLGKHAIDFILVETCFRKDRVHIDFREYMEFFDSYGYLFYGLYDQMREWDQAAAIQYANALFVDPVN